MPALKRWQRVLLGLLIILILLPVVLIKWGVPMAVNYAFNQFLVDQDLEGHAPTLDISLLDRRITLSQLSLTRPDGTELLRIPALSLDLDLGGLMNRTLHIPELSLAGAWLSVVQDNDHLEIAGQTMPTGQSPEQDAAPEEKPWAVRIDRIRLSDNRIHLTRAEKSTTLSLNRLDLDRLRIMGTHISLAARLDAQINQNSSLALTGEVVTQPALFIHARLERAELHREDLNTLVQLPPELGNATIRMSGDTRFTRGALPRIEVDQARLSLYNLSAKIQDLNLSTEEATLENLALALELPDGRPPVLKASAAVSVAPLQVENDQGQWLGWQRLEIPALHVSGPETPDIRASQIRFTDLLLSRVRQAGDAPDAPPLFQTKTLTLTDLVADDSSLQISDAGMNGAHGLIALDSTGQLATLIPVPDASGESPPPRESTAENGNPTPENNPATSASDVSTPLPAFALRIDSLTLDNESTLQFRDGGVQPPFERTLFFEHLRLTGLQNTSPSAPAHLDTAFSTDAGAQLSILADLTPFARPPGFSIQLTGQQIALPRLSAYLEHTLGYQIESGDLDTRVIINGHADAFTGTASLKMTRLDLKGRPGSTQSASTAIPLDVALDQLKESDGIIELDIPFEHKAGESDVGLGSFVALIMKKALYQAAKTYVVNTFVPYANVVSVVALAGEQLFKLRFEPLPYDAGQLLPRRPQMDYLAAMKAVLEKRPTALKLCPVALPDEADTLSADDIAKLPEDLRKLPAVRVLAQKLEAGIRGEPLALAFADARAAIFRYMAGFSGLSGKTFISCGPVIDTGAGQPMLAFRVD